MNPGLAADNGIVLYDDMTGKHRPVSENDPVADLAVVGYMGSPHQKAITADAGDPAFAGPR